MKLTLDMLLKNFHPDYTPRDIQVAALEKYAAAYNNGAAYVVAEMPVGSGKSLFAMAIAKTLGTSFALTLTEQLQLQYLKDFQRTMGMEALKGRAKYTCARAGEGFTCADGKVMFEGKNKCGPETCTYQLAKSRAFSADHLVANYHSFYFNLGLSAGKKRKAKNPDVPMDAWPPNDDPRRDLTIIDEAHAMEGFLLDQVGVTVRLDKLPIRLAPLPNTPDVDNVDTQAHLDFMREELVPKLAEYIATSEKRGILDPRTKDELESTLAKCRAVLAAAVADGAMWIAEREEGRDRKSVRGDVFSLKPLRVDAYGTQLTGFGKTLLLMSGTVLNPYQLVTSVGLDPASGEDFTFDSPFPVENRPVFVGNLDMSYKARDESWPLMVEQVQSLLEAHSTQKGLLLTSSTTMLMHIVKELNQRAPSLGRRILVATGENRVAKYNEHCASRAPTVLGASGFWEGADLKGNLSEFQIIPSLPRPMFKGQIAARAKRDKGWYEWLTYTKVLQGFGRSVRSETDTAVTYVLDRAFRTEAKKKVGSLVPLWVKSSLKFVNADGAVEDA